MAEKRTIELEVNSNLGNLKQQLKAAQVEVQTLSEKFGAASAEAIEAAKAAAILSDKIQDAKALTEAFNPDAKFKAVTNSLTGVENGFSVVTGAMGAFGAQSTEVEQALLKVQSAMAMASGLQQVGESIDSFKQLGAVIKSTSVFQGIYNYITTGSFKAIALQTAAKVADTEATIAQGTATVATTTATTGATAAAKILRIALISTGVGALVVAVGLLIANFDAVKTAIVGAYDKFNKLGPAIKTVIMIMFPIVGLFVGIGKALEYFGVVDDETTRKNKANAEARTKAVEKEANRAAALAKKKQKDDDDKYTHEINLAKASGKEVYEMELKKAKAHLASGRVFLAAQNEKIKAYKNEIEMLIATGDADSDRVKSLKKSLTTAKTLAAESYQDNVATKNAIEVMEVEHQTEIANTKKNAGSKAKEKRDELAAKELADLKAKQEKENALIEEMRVSRLSAESKELDALNLAYKAKIDIAKGMGEKGLELVKELETNQGIEAAKIRKKYSDLSAEEQQKLYDEKKQQAKTINDLILSDEELAIIAISQKRIAAEKELLKLLEDKKIDNAQYNAGMLKAGKEQEDALLKIKTDSLKVFEDLMTTDQEKAIEEIHTKNDAELLLLQDNLAKKLITEEEFLLAKKALTEKTTNDLKKLELDAALAVLEQKSAIQQKGLDVASQGIGLIKGLFEKSKGVQKAAVIAESAIGIAKMIIANRIANAGALATPQAIASSGVSAIPVIALNNISTGIGIAANVAATAKALNTLGGGAPPPAPNDNSTPTGGAPQAPQFNVVGNNGMNQLAQLQQQPIQAYVVSSEMTSAQSLERNRINNATI